MVDSAMAWGGSGAEGNSVCPVATTSGSYDRLLLHIAYVEIACRAREMTQYSVDVLGRLARHTGYRERDLLTFGRGLQFQHVTVSRVPLALRRPRRVSRIEEDGVARESAVVAPIWTQCRALSPCRRLCRRSRRHLHLRENKATNRLANDLDSRRQGHRRQQILYPHT